MKFSKALITGGAGFIGSFFCDKLYDEGVNFTIIDNLFRGKLENVSSLLNKQNKFYKLDLVDHMAINKIADIIIKEQPDLIVHYAAINGTEHFYDNPSLVAETNSIGTYNLFRAMEMARKRGFDKRALIVFSSTSEVYGEPFEIPTSEEDITYARVQYERDSYAIAKLMSEFYMKLFCKELGLDCIILRIFNVYGPRMVGTKYGQVIPEFINRLNLGEYPLRIIGDGQQTRSFCFIDDHINLTWKLINSPKSYNGIYNVGNPDEIKILDLAKRLMLKFGLDAKFSFIPGRDGDHLRRRPDISKLLSTIGKYDFMSLDDGLDRILEHL